jgi:hypothetical protein
MLVACAPHVKVLNRQTPEKSLNSTKHNYRDIKRDQYHTDIAKQIQKVASDCWNNGKRTRSNRKGQDWGDAEMPIGFRTKEAVDIVRAGLKDMLKDFDRK